MAIKVTFLYNSGFMVETDNDILIFDDCDDPAHSVVKALKHNPEKNVLFLTSHNHSDHFNKFIFDLAQNHRRMYILSDDIMSTETPDTAAIGWMHKGDVIENIFDGIRIKAFGSTDAGVSYMVELPDGKRIFHAGDLNNWHWDEASTEHEIAKANEAFTVIVNRIAEEYPAVDIAFFPIDVRLGKNRATGAEQFLAAIKTANFFPMHFKGSYEEACDFGAYKFSDTVKKETKFYCLHKPGQSVEL